MLKIRRPLGRLIFNMGIAIPGKTVFLIETAPRLSADAQRQSISQGDRPTHEYIRAIKWDALPYHVRVSGAGWPRLVLYMRQSEVLANEWSLYI